MIHTDAVQPLAWRSFTRWSDSVTHNYAFQTDDGHFITAVNAGGMTSNAIHSDANKVLGWELFKLVPQSQLGPASYAIQTQKGFYLTAVGGGGHASGETIHTDAKNAREWEFFDVIPLRGDGRIPV